MRVVKWGEKSLLEVSKPVEEINDYIRELISEMFKTMYEENGIGLAGPQVGVNLRLAVIGLDGKEYVVINPQILETSQELHVMEEGCLSMPGVYAPATRPKRVKVQYMDLDGRRRTIDADGMLAKVFQHEIDHLDGMLYIHRADEETRERTIKRYERKQANAAKRRRRRRH